MKAVNRQINPARLLFGLMAVGLIFSALLFLGGCASSLKGDVYTRDEARQSQEVRLGVVEALRAVQIEGTKSNIGAGAGGIVGAIAGSNVGGGKGQTIAAVVGAVVGGMAGAAAEEGITRTQGVEITVLEDSGILRAYVQELDEGQVFRVGDRVRVIVGRDGTRVSRY